MERASINAELAGDSQRIVQLLLFRNVLLCIRSWPYRFALRPGMTIAQDWK
jgi:hypothetical protein